MTSPATSMRRLGRREKLARLPGWLRRRIEVNRIETLRMLEEARVALPEGASVLDAGSGEGRYREYFQHTKYVGIDLAVGDHSWDYSTVDVIGDLRCVPIASESFDAVVCVQTLEHVNDPFAVVSEMARVLKPSGQLFLSAPMNWHQHQKPHDFFRYTSFGFRHLIENAGLEAVTLRPWGGYFWFLSFNLQLIHAFLFPKARNRWQWWLQVPFQAIVHLIFFLLLPLILFYMDRFDKEKDHTLGWVCIAVKGADESAAASS